MYQPVHVSEIPESGTTFSYLKEKFSFQEAIRDVRPRMGRQRHYQFSLLPGVCAELRDSVLSIIGEIGYRGWQGRDGESKGYQGISLTYNPDHQDNLDPNFSTLGTPRNASDEYYWNRTEHHNSLKNSYFDSYGFRRRTPASRCGSLGTFVDALSLSLIRSRVGIISGQNVDATNPLYQEKAGWHKDEPVFENLRINIPLQTDEAFVFQMVGEGPYHLKFGAAYSWDTHRPHRVFCQRKTTAIRIHLVLGVAPWFTYNEEDDSWRPNQYFGRMHPFDMLLDGRVHPQIHE